MGGWDDGVYVRKVGGVLVDVLGQEVLHGCGVEHDAARFVGVGTLTEGVVDVAEDARLRCLRKMYVENLDAGDGGVFLLGPRFLSWI